MRKISSLLLVSALACTPRHSTFAETERGLLEQVFDSFEPNSTSGRELGCHTDPIIWLHLRVEFDGWTLTSIDAVGHVKRWTRRGLYRAWTLAPDELAEILTDREWSDLAKTDPSLREEAKLPKLFDRRTVPHAPPSELDDIAPRRDGSWLGVPVASSKQPPPGESASVFVGSGRRLATDRSWFAIGDEHGNLMVAKIGARRPERGWYQPACRPSSSAPAM